MDEDEIIDFAKADLGCGTFRKFGYMGYDNFEAALWQGLTGVHRQWIIEWDLNRCIPIPSDSLTDIYCSHFIEHVESPFNFMSECYRVLKPNGHLEIYTPIHEMESVGHVTDMDEFWFERFCVEQMAGKWSMVRKSIEIKLIEIRTKDASSLMKNVDVLNVVLKCVK